MAPSRTTKESGGEIARRYGLDDLSRARRFVNRYYFNSLASKAFSLIYDMVPGDEDVDTALPRYLRYASYRRPYYLRDIPVLPRRNIPTIAARMLYDRRLAEHTAERREALKRADTILSRYYLDHDPLALLDVPDEELDLDNFDDDEGGATDKHDGAKDKSGPDTGTTSNEQPPALPDSRSSRRTRYPRLSAEGLYRILEGGI